MNLKEHDRNITTKEKTDVEKYLLRIIQRYFDIENNFSKESIEEMIIESLTRFKRLIISEKGFIFSLNKKTGHLKLTIRDFGGEEAFSKNTAFNKDFGVDADTICEGNDPRLFDAREPLYHNHIIGDVNGLQEALDNVVFPTGTHIHNNKQNVLDLLRYTGKRTEIDLILLEYLENAINEYYKNLEFYKKELGITHKSNIEKMTGLMLEVEEKLQEARKIVENAKSWVEEANKYTDSKILALINKSKQELLKYITNEDITSLIDFFKKPFRVVADGEIPITNGEITYTPIEEESTTEAGSEEGDSLKEIYDNGLRFGNDDWTWDDVNKSFVYQHNEESSYPMFASLNVFNTYTHRVTLSSDDSDDDVISVVIAYDDDSKKHLSLLVSTGGVNAYGVNGANASVVLNYTGNYSMSGSFTLESKQIGSYNSWRALTNGITVLVKKEKNNVKLWINYDTPNTWQPTTVDNKKDIYVTETPDFEFDMSVYPELTSFIDKKCNYGYGCFSQPKATYKDVYFIGTGTSLSTSTGHTNVNESKNISYQISSSIINKIHNGKVKMFFRYEDEDGKMISSPLPYSFINQDNSNIVIQGTYTTTGEINIHSNFINKAPALYSNVGIYQNSIIGCGKYKLLSVYDIEKSFIDMGIELCKIDSLNKNNFVSSLIKQDDKNIYMIQGINYYDFSESEDFYYYGEPDPIEYFNWDNSQPDITKQRIGIQHGGKWVSLDYFGNEFYVLEYRIKRLTDYFKNPRIYYQVLGNEEVV